MSGTAIITSGSGHFLYLEVGYLLRCVAVLLVVVPFAEDFVAD